MSKYAPACFNEPTTVYCPDGVRLAQVGIVCTGLFNILFGLLIQRIGKERLDKVLPPIVTGNVAIVIGLALAGSALNMASANWGVALIIIPQLPQMAMRHDQRNVRLPSRWSLMYCRPCNTDMSSRNGTS
mgnify:CR=1 FL=1